MNIRKLIIFAFLALQSTLIFADDSYYKLGVEAFKSKRFDEALSYFEKAQKSSENNSAIDYNLGVTYYKLERYDDAENSFLNIPSDDSMFFLAQFNLGLVSLKQNDLDSAIDHFLFVMENTDDPKLSTLAEKKLNKILSEDQLENVSKNELEFDVGLKVGYDNHLTLYQERNSGNYAGDNGDNYYNISANVTFPVWKDSIKLNGYFDSVSYSENSEYNTVTTGGDLTFEFGEGDTDYSLSFGLDNNWSNGEQYLLTSLLSAEINHQINSNWLASFQYTFSYYSAEQYNYYLDGNSHELLFEAGYFENSWQLVPYYSYSKFNRKDINIQLLAYSYSPSVHKIGALLNFNLPYKIDLDIDGGFSISKYGTPDRLLIYERYRDDQNLFATISLSKKLSSNWELSSTVDYLNKDSNIKIEDHERTDFSITLTFNN